MSNREDNIQKAEAQLKEWSAQIDLLKAKGENLAADAKVDFRKKLDEAEEKWNTVSKTFSDFVDKFK